MFKCILSISVKKTPNKLTLYKCLTKLYYEPYTCQHILLLSCLVYLNFLL